MIDLRFECGNNERLLTDALAVRNTVFVNEQAVPIERENDGLDIPPTIHYVGYNEGAAVCVARTRPIYPEALGSTGAHDIKIERVAVMPNFRGQHVGEAIMAFLLDRITDSTSVRDAILESQTHAESFYRKLGFTTEGEVFEDVGIPHIKMRKHIGERPTPTVLPGSTAEPTKPKMPGWKEYAAAELGADGKKRDTDSNVVPYPHHLA